MRALGVFQGEGTILETGGLSEGPLPLLVPKMLVARQSPFQTEPGQAL